MVIGGLRLETRNFLEAKMTIHDQYSNWGGLAGLLFLTILATSPMVGGMLFRLTFYGIYGWITQSTIDPAIVDSIVAAHW